MTVRNSSFSANEGVSGIIFVMGDINPDINARLVNVTLTNNLTQSCTIESNWGARLSMSNSLVPPDASRALAGLVGSEDYTELGFKGGHIGIYVSSRAQREVPAAIHRWLSTRGGT